MVSLKLIHIAGIVLMGLQSLSTFVHMSSGQRARGMLQYKIALLK